MKFQRQSAISCHPLRIVGTYNRIPRGFIPGWFFLLLIVIGWGHLTTTEANAQADAKANAEANAEADAVQVTDPEGTDAEIVGDIGIFHDEQRITAVDLLVTYERQGVREWAAGQELPQDLALGDFEVRVDGNIVDIVAMAPPADMPWHFLLYFDAVLTTPETTIWAATQLSEHLDLLLAHGQIEIVIADPLPRRLLKTTDDRDEVARVLAQLALQPIAAAQLQHLRDEFLTLVAETPASQEIVDLLVIEEQRIVGQRQDQLATWLVDRSLPSPADRRALFYVSDGFDVHPETFYGSFLDDTDTITVEIGPEVEVEAAEAQTTNTTRAPDLSMQLSQVLASYGWVALPMLPPEPELLTRGLRLGKFLIKPLGPHMINAEPEEAARADQYGLRALTQRLGQIFLAGISMKYEEHRDVDKAKAYLDLAKALHGQDKLEDAAEAYHKALFHFSGDPRTADLQAEAMAGIGDMMAELGDRQGAQRAYHKALLLAPDMAENVGTGIAFNDAAGALSPWAEATVGRLLRQPGDLQQFFGSLVMKIRLTYQLNDLPSGQLQEVEARLSSRPALLRHPRWTRSGTPEIVTEARLRQLLETHLSLTALGDGEALDGGEAPPPTIETRLDEQGEVQLSLRRPELAEHAVFAEPAVEDEELPKLKSTLRLSLASAPFDGPARIVHRRIVLDGAAQTVDIEDDLDVDAQAWVALVEDLVSGSWQARLLDLP